jgi:hypothetical protein
MPTDKELLPLFDALNFYLALKLLISVDNLL